MKSKLIYSLILLLAVGCAGELDYSKFASRVFEPESKYNPIGENFFFTNLSPQELKILQTKKYNKSLSEISVALRENCKDRNGQEYSFGTSHPQCILPPEKKSEYHFKYEIRGNDNESKPLYVAFHYELSPTTDKISTTIRLRAYFYLPSLTQQQQNRQITHTKFYMDEFKKITEKLNSEPIELSGQDSK